MDTFAHALWTNAVYFPKYKKNFKQRTAAVLFGVLPDIISLGPVFLFYFLFAFTGLNFLGQIRNWIMHYYSHQAYALTHSLVIFVVVFLLITLVKKGKIYWPVFGWALHILIDIPTHKNFYETPFLYPISKYTFSYGISWGRLWFMLANYLSLFVVYGIIYFYKKRQKNPR